MKKIFTIFLVSLSFNAMAQKVNKIKYDIDTLSFNGEKIAIRRSSQKQIAKYMTMGTENYQVADNIMSLQEFLNGFRRQVVGRSRIMNIKPAEEKLNAIKNIDPAFDVSLYDGELSFYKRYTNEEDKRYIGYNALTPAILELDSSLKAVTDFNEKLLHHVEGYQIISIDTMHDGNLAFIYKNNDGDELIFAYGYEMKGYNPDLKEKGIKTIVVQNISGQFLTMLKIYNALYNTNVTIDEAQSKKSFVSQIVYNGSSYISLFGKDHQPGYWHLIIKNR